MYGFRRNTVCAIYAYSIYIYVFVTRTWITNYHTFPYTGTRIHTHADIHTYHYITFPFHSLRVRVHTYNLHRKLRHRFISLFADSLDLPKLLPNVHLTWLEASQPSLHVVAFSFFLRFPLGLGGGNSLHSSWHGAL